MSITFSPSKDFNINEDCRLVIYNLNTKNYYKVIKINAGEDLIFDEEEVLSNPWTYAYKFQITKNEKIITLSSNLPFINTNKIERIFKNYSDEDYEFNDILTNDCISMPVMHKFMFNRLVQHFTNDCITRTNLEVSKNMKNFIYEVFKKFQYEECFLVNICLYLKYMIEIKEIFRKHNVKCSYFDFLKNKLENDEIIKCIKNLIDEYQLLKNKLPFASNLIIGKLYDLLADRKNAARCFKQAIDFDKDYLRYIINENTIYTYIDDIDTFPVLENKINMFELPEPNKKVTIVFSVDEKFFRAYISNILNISTVLKEINFHIHIIGNYASTKQLIYEALDIYENINKIVKNKSQKPTFSTEEIPSYVNDKRTFYACSRYINAQYFMNLFNTDIFIMDIDAIFYKLPFEYFKECLEHDVCLPIRTDPLWTCGRRVLAGLVYFKNNEKSREFLNMTKNYMLSCFKIPYDLWVLDQNALEYATVSNIINQLNIDVCNSNTMLEKRPVGQNIFRGVLEKYEYSDQVECIYDIKYVNVLDKIIEKYKVSNTSYKECKTTILISVDEKFLRLYCTEILILCNALNDIHFHIHAIGNKERLSDLIKDIEKLYNSINKVRKKTNNQLSFSIEDIPKHMKEVTYYSCSRYMKAQYFMDLFETDIYIIDADTVFISSPYQYLNKMKKYDVSISKVSYPISKVIPNYAYFSKTEKSKQFLNLINQFIVENIYNDIESLDAKAIEYAINFVKSNLIDIKIHEFQAKRIDLPSCNYDPNVHVTQNAFKSFLENNYELYN